MLAFRIIFLSFILSQTNLGIASVLYPVRQKSQAQLHKIFKIINQDKNKLNLTATKNTVNSSKQLYHLNFPICNSFFRIERLKNNTLVGMGQLPSNEDLKLLFQIKEKPKISINLPDLERKNQKIVSMDHCWYLMKTDEPMWVLASSIAYIDRHLLFEAIYYKNKFIKIEPRYLHLEDAVARIDAYESNHKAGTIKTFEIEIEGDQNLVNRFFFTSVENGQIAVGTDRVFNFEPSTPEFAESNVFVHANAILAFFQSIGFSWEQNEKKMRLELAETVNGSPYNGLYQPDDGNGSPIISIAPGDPPGASNGVLVGLRLDRDVTMHEFSHHIVAKKLRIEQRTLSLHEGLADYFTFAATENSCLGESICGPKAGTQTCFLAETCMRTAENSILYKSDQYNNLPFHHKGQIVSGILWQLRGLLDLPSKKTFDQFVLKSLNYIPVNADIVDYINALVVADEKENNSQFRCQIIDTATSRGFLNYLAVKDCNATTELPPPEEEKKEKNPIERAFGCSIGGNSENSSIIWYLLLPIFMAPFTKWMFRRSSSC